MLTLSELFNQIIIDIKKTNTIQALEALRIKYLGKKSILHSHMSNIKNFSNEEKKKYSMTFHQIKRDIHRSIDKKNKELNLILLHNRIKEEKIDITLPGRRVVHGVLHPITNTINDIKKFFLKIGFQSISSPEVEDEYHNFDALNIPKNHPARDSHDTFWIDSYRLLRTQTSSMQIRIMKKEKPPMRYIFPGKVYRKDYDATHTPMFHQIEGLIVDKNISFSNLKWIIYNFLYDFFGEKISIKFRPSYFPFTVPSAEVDLVHTSGESLEILGCGMVHPQVLKNVNIDSTSYSACAFGIGIERLTMLRYGISDLRLFFENDIRFLKQFRYN